MRSKFKFGKWLQKAGLSLLLWTFSAAPGVAQVGGPPVITVQPLDQTVSRGGTAIFTVLAASTTTLSYQWYFNNEAISGATANTYLKTDVDCEDAGLYCVAVKNSSGTVYSRNASLTVLGCVEVDSSSSTSTNDTTLSWPHKIADGDNRILIVTAAVRDSRNTVTSVNYGGIALTQAGSASAMDNANGCSIWHLVAPPVGVNNVVVTLSGSAKAAAGATSLTGVDQFTPVGAFVSANGQSKNPAVTHLAVANHLVIDVLAVNGDAKSATPGAGQTQQWNRTTGSGGGEIIGASSTKPGSLTTTMSWTLKAGKPWVLGSVALKPVSTRPSADIATTINGPAIAIAGNPIDYNITVTNLGPFAATNVAVRYTMPAGATFVSATAGGALIGGNVVWPNLGTFAQGSHTQFGVTVIAAAAGILTNTVRSTADTDDPRPANNNGSSPAATVITEVAVPPTIIAELEDQSVMVGQGVTLSVAAAGTDPLGYMWLRDGKPLAGVNSPELTLANIQPEDAGSYSVIVTNCAGEATSTATVKVAEPGIVSPPELHSAAMTPEGFTFRFELPVGQTYIVLATTNLQDWTPIATNVARTGSVVFTDSAAATLGSRYYRVAARGATEILEANQVSSGNKIEVKLGQKGAQSFRHGATGQPGYYISKVVLRLSRDPSVPDADLQFSIGTVVNAGDLSGSTVNIAPSSITDLSAGNSFQTYEISFGVPVGPLAAGTTYHLNLECEASNGKSIWLQYSDGEVYPNGDYFKDGSPEDKDVRFEIWGMHAPAAVVMP